MARRTIKPKIVFFNRVYPPYRGASGRVLRDLAKAFVNDGWQVTIITTGDKTAKESDGAITVIRKKAPVRSKRILPYCHAWLAMLIAGLRLPKQDLVVSLTDPPMLVVAARFVAKSKKAKHIHWCHDLYPDLLDAFNVKMPHFVRRFLTKTSNRSLKQCDKIITIGRCLGHNIVRKGVEPSNVAMIPNWADKALFLNQETRSDKGNIRRFDRIVSRARKAANLRAYEDLMKDTKDRKFRVLYAGNLGKAHSYETVLQSISLLKETCKDVEFVFIGEGRNYKRLAREKSLRQLGNLRLLPPQPPQYFKDIMQSGDLHLVLMNEETAGLLVPCKFYASIAVERPCLFVGPENCEIAHVIDDFELGSVINGMDAMKLAEEIKRYRFDGAYWLAAHEGAKKARAVFVPEESIKAWISRARDVAGLKSTTTQKHSRIKSKKKASSKRNNVKKRDAA